MLYYVPSRIPLVNRAHTQVELFLLRWIHPVLNQSNTNNYRNNPMALPARSPVTSPVANILRFASGGTHSEIFKPCGRPQTIRGTGVTPVMSHFNGLGSCSFKLIGNTSPKCEGGDVVSYVAQVPLKPIELCAALVDQLDPLKYWKAYEYAEYFYELRMLFSPKQVSLILRNFKSWKGVDTDGMTNLFPVWSGGNASMIVANFQAGRWEAHDSHFGMGRGTNAGVHIHLRNAFVDPEAE